MDGIEMLQCWNEVKIGGDGVMGDWGVGMASFGHFLTPSATIKKETTDYADYTDFFVFSLCPLWLNYFYSW
jgi:hypothetical protein